MKSNSCSCRYCHSRLVNYVHGLSKILARSLETFAKVAGEKELRLTKAGLSHTEIANFQKLRYFGLAAKGIDEGTWRVTDDGFRFLAGQIPVPERAITFRGQRIAFEGKGRFFEMLTGHKYQGRVQYAMEARPVDIKAQGKQLPLMAA